MKIDRVPKRAERPKNRSTESECVFVDGDRGYCDGRYYDGKFVHEKFDESWLVGWQIFGNDVLEFLVMWRCRVKRKFR